MFPTMRRVGYIHWALGCILWGYPGTYSNTLGVPEGLLEHSGDAREPTLVPIPNTLGTRVPRVSTLPWIFPFPFLVPVTVRVADPDSYSTGRGEDNMWQGLFQARKGAGGEGEDGR